MHFLYRCGIALALNKLSQHLDSSQVKPLFLFFVPDALNDRSPDVRKCMLDAALSTLNTHGKVNLRSHFFPNENNYIGGPGCCFEEYAFIKVIGAK